MKAHETLILVCALIALIVGIGWMLYNGLRRRWPEGKRTDFELPANSDTGRLRMYLFVANGASIKADTINCGPALIAAIWSCAVAWNMARKDGRVTKDDSPVREVIVRIETEAGMAAVARSWGFKKLSGFISKFKTSIWGGEELPLITVSELNVTEAISTGEPIIHEMCHGLERDYVGGKDDHSNPVVWSAAASREGAAQPSIQDVARSIYTVRAWEKILQVTSA